MSSYGPTPTASSNAGDIDNVAAAVQSSDPESLTPARKKLRGLGYDFNDEGILRQFKSGKLTNKKFEFRDQDHYEKLGDTLTEYVYELLVSEAELERKDLIDDSFIFVSNDWDSNPKLLILIHGSGVVRAGQWARRLIINDSLDDGTQLPYIKKAKELGFAVMVFNTNEPYEKGPDGGSPVAHAKKAWRQFVKKTNAKHIAIVAHSFGGIVTLNLALEFKGDFLNRVFSVMLTDSVHHLDPKNKEKELVHFLRKISINFVASDEELGTPIRSKIEAIPMVSAGHEVHEWTSTSCKELLFEQLLSRLNKRLSENPNSEGGGSNPADSI